MRHLDVKDLQVISGGDVAVVVNATVPTADVPVFSTLLADFLTGGGAAAVGASITANVASYDNMQFGSAQVGPYLITTV